MEENLVEASTLAKVFNFEGVRRIDQLVQDGVIKPTMQNVNGKMVRRYDLIPTVMLYIKHLQAKANSKAGAIPNAIDHEARRIKAEADLKEAKAVIERLKKAEFEATMHRSEDVEAVVGDMVSKLRAEILALPGGLAKDVVDAKDAAQASGIIKAAVNDILNRMAQYKYDKGDFRRRVRRREKWMNEHEEDESK